MNAPTPPGCRLYLVTPPSFEPAKFRDVLAAAVEAGDVGCLRLALAGATEAMIRLACTVLMPVAQARDVAFILDGRPDLAAKFACDGVHIGAEDDYKAARAAMGPSLVVGVSCGTSRHAAIEAAEAGADYVAFGRAPDPATTELVEWWSDVMTVPCVAAGNITLDNCAPLIAAGADFITVGQAVWSHPQGAADAVRAFNAAIAKHARRDVTT